MQTLLHSDTMPTPPRVLASSEYFDYGTDGNYRTRLINPLSPRIGRVVSMGIQLFREQQSTWRNDDLRVVGRLQEEFIKREEDEVIVACVDNPRLLCEGLDFVRETNDPFFHSLDRRAYARIMRVDLADFLQELALDGLIR